MDTYEKLNLEVIRFETEDVILTSGEGNVEGGGEDIHMPQMP